MSSTGSMRLLTIAASGLLLAGVAGLVLHEDDKEIASSRAAPPASSAPGSSTPSTPSGPGGAAPGGSGGSSTATTVQGMPGAGGQTPPPTTATGGTSAGGSGLGARGAGDVNRGSNALANTGGAPSAAVGMVLLAMAAAARGLAAAA